MADETQDRTLRNVSGGFRSLCLVHDEDIATDPGEVVTATMSDAEYDDALATGWFEDASDSDPGEVVTATVDEILAALDQLDPANDDHWTADGLPAMKVIEELVGRDVSRKEVSEAAPDFKRPTE